MICLDYIVQVQDYPPLFGLLHDAFLNSDALFKRMTYHLMITAVFGVNSPSNFFRPLRLWKLNDPFSRRSSSIWISRNGYFFSWSSIRAGRLLIMSLKDALLFFYGFSLPLIRKGSALEMVIVSLVEFLENLTFFLNSALSFFNSATLKELLRRLAMVTTISCALVANSWKVQGLLI